MNRNPANKEHQEQLSRKHRGRLREIIKILAKNEMHKGVTPAKVRAVIEDLGPTFVKLGQIMSMRMDTLPPAYCEELVKLRVDVRPMPFPEVQGVIESEYGRPLLSVFRSFEEAPIGSASIAQVHSAVLKNGDRVAVKVQRPGIRETMARDIALLHRAARLFNLAHVAHHQVIDLHMVLDEMWQVAQQEMNFLLEAQNAEEFRAGNAEVAFVSTPRIEHSLTTAKVLVMEFIEGYSIDDLDALREQGYDLAEIGAKLADNYVKQIIDEGFFQADPHPGNLRIREGKIIWIDMGMMGRISPKDKALLRQAVGAIVKGDIEEIKQVIMTMGVCHKPIDHDQLYLDIDGLFRKYGSMGMANINLGKMLEEVMGIAKAHHISMPKGVSMLGRGMITIEGVLAVLSPETNIIEIMSNRMFSEIVRDFNWQKELVSTMRKLYQSSRKMVDLPSQLSDFLHLALKGQAKVNVKFLGAEHLASATINRMIKCIFSSALLIGSCLICTTEMQPKILHIPLLGLVGFAAALVLGSWVLVDIRRGK